MKRERVTQSKPFVLVKVEPPKARKETPTDAKGKLKTRRAHNCDIKCLDVQGLKTMFLSI
jgi:hypothetical protein